MTGTRVAALTVTYADRTALVVETVARAIRAGADSVLVVANGSAPAVLEHLRSECAERFGQAVDVAHSALNLGSSGGFGLGLSMLQQRPDLDLIWLLDDDNWAEPGSLVESLRVLRSTDPAPVAVACYRAAQEPQRRVAAGEDPVAVYPRPGSALYLDFRSVPARVARLLRRHPAGARSRSTEVRAVPIPLAPYGGLLLRRSTLAAIGLPRTDFVLYGDDYEFTSRFGRAGGVILLALDAVVLDADQLDARVAPISSTPEQNGLRPFEALLRTPPEFHERVFYRVRNDLYLDLQRLSSRRDRLALLANGSLFFLALGVFALKDRRNHRVAGLIVKAARAARKGRLGEV